MVFPACMDRTVRKEKPGRMEWMDLEAIRDFGADRASEEVLDQQDDKDQKEDWDGMA